jgi:hypothetical protein
MPIPALVHGSRLTVAGSPPHVPERRDLSGAGQMTAAKPSLVHPPYKTKYRVENWREYEAGLRARGDVTIWFSEEAIQAWTPRPNGRRGGQRRYSDLAIETALTLRLVFHLPLRQAEGFVGSLLRLMRLDLVAPDHTTLSRRATQLDIVLRSHAAAGPIHLIVRQHGPRDRRSRPVGSGETR